MRISTGLEDCLEALDETADHSRDLVDRAGSDPADLGLALDGRVHEVGSSLRGVVKECAQRKFTVQTAFTAVRVIEASHVPDQTNLQLSSQFDTATKLKLPSHHLGGLLGDSPLFQVISRKRYEIFHSSSTFRNVQ